MEGKPDCRVEPSDRCFLGFKMDWANQLTEFIAQEEPILQASSIYREESLPASTLVPQRREVNSERRFLGLLMKKGSLIYSIGSRVSERKLSTQTRKSSSCYGSTP